LAFAVPVLVGLILQNILGQVLARQRILKEGSTVFYSTRELFFYSKHFGRISATGVLSNFDGVLLSWITSIGDSSGYLLSQRFRNPLTIVFTSIGMRLRSIAASRNRDRIIQALQFDARMLTFGSIFNVVTAFIFLFFSQKFFGEDFKSVNVFLFWGALSSIPLGILLLSSTLLSSLGFEKYTARVNLSYSVSSLFGVCVGALFFGSLGAILTVFIVITIHAILFSVKFFRELEQLK
jgi:O-antigen/teichoic acid export membrane protein